MSDLSQDPGEGVRRQVAVAFKEADGHLHEAIRTLEDLRDELMDPDADANTDDDEALCRPRPPVRGQGRSRGARIRLHPAESNPPPAGSRQQNGRG